MLETRPSRTGPMAAFRDGVALTSTYDPRREAERFVAAQCADGPPGTVLVMGEVLGYLGAAVEALYPGSRVIRVFYDAELAGLAGETLRPFWHPGLGATPQHFLRAELGVMDLEGLKVLAWPPSDAAYPELSRSILEAVAQTVRELNGTIATTVSRGRRWLRNSVLNALRGPDPLVRLPLVPGLPLVIAASGPSLEEALPILRSHRGALAIWALPSAVACLLGAGVEPDLVVMTDPVYYSILHLYPAAGRDPVVAMPLAASPGVWRVTSRVVYLAQPSFYEEALLGAIGFPVTRVQPHGTVAGTALELALRETAGVPVVMAGLDLCTRDILSHCRPNAFERFLEPAVGRTSPLYHAMASRTLDTTRGTSWGIQTRTSLPLQTYAGWFASSPALSEGRVRRLHPSPVALDGMPAIGAAELGRMAEGARAGQAPCVDAAERRPRAPAVLALIRGWRSAVRAAAAKPEDPGPTATAMARELGLRELMEMRSRLRRGETQSARRLWTELVGRIDADLAQLQLLAETSSD